MKVRYIGRQGDPDFIMQYGYRFERKGKAIEVPDDHPRASKFVNNPFFEVKGEAVDALTAESPEPDDNGDLGTVEPPAVPAQAS